MNNDGPNTEPCGTQCASMTVRIMLPISTLCSSSQIGGKPVLSDLVQVVIVPVLHKASGNHLLGDFYGESQTQGDRSRKEVVSNKFKRSINWSFTALTILQMTMVTMVTMSLTIMWDIPIMAFPMVNRDRAFSYDLSIRSDVWRMVFDATACTLMLEYFVVYGKDSHLSPGMHAQVSGVYR